MAGMDTRTWMMPGVQARTSLRADARRCALLMTIALTPVTAAAPARSETPPVAADHACAPVRRAIEQLNEQKRVHLHAVTGTGRNPGGYQTADSYLIDDQQWLYLDGRLNAHGRARREDGTRDRANGVAMLAPPEECESLAPTTIEGRPVQGFRYDVPVEVGLNRVTMWIDPASGLPLRVSIVGPEWVMGRVLSRPGTPPQVKPKKNGRRYSERVEFRYDGVRVP